MKISTKILLYTALMMGVFMSSCKRSDNSIYYYNVEEDVIAPEVKISVPEEGALFNLTYDVHVVGTVKDLETEYTAGSLKSLSVRVDQLDNVSGEPIKILLNKTPLVDGKEGYTFNEKFVVNYAPQTVKCLLTVTAYDQTGRFDIKTREFSINP